MLYLCGAFVFGLMIPYMARRFAKFMPATLATAMVEIAKAGKKNKHYRQTRFYKKYVVGAILRAAICVALTWLWMRHFGLAGFGFWVAYLWILLLLAEIDWRSFFLPDILTIPLMLVGLSAVLFGFGVVGIENSILGAISGYLLPTLVSLLIVWYQKDAFGGGDIKLLMAVGAWLGIEGLLRVIALAAILGLGYALIRRQRSLAFGPMIAVSAIVIAFWLF